MAKLPIKAPKKLPTKKPVPYNRGNLSAGALNAARSKKK